MLKPAHYIAIGAAVGLVALLWFGGNTVPPKKAVATDNSAPHQGGGMAAMPGPNFSPASTDSILAAARQATEGPLRDSIALLEQRMAGMDSASMAPVFEQLAGMWQRARQPFAAAYAHGMTAHLEHSVKKLTFAAQFYRQAAMFEVAPTVQLWAANGAVNAWAEAAALEPDNDTLQLALAESYLDGTGETMKGVGILRDVVARKPNDLHANLMLGKLSIQSGQIDKAIARLETVLRVAPENREGLYLMAEAYRAKGDKAKAISLLDKLKRIVNDPAFSKDIDDYIKTF